MISCSFFLSKDVDDKIYWTIKEGICLRCDISYIWLTFLSISRFADGVVKINEGVLHWVNV